MIIQHTFIQHTQSGCSCWRRTTEIEQAAGAETRTAAIVLMADGSNSSEAAATAEQVAMYET